MTQPNDIFLRCLVQFYESHNELDALISKIVSTIDLLNNLCFENESLLEHNNHRLSLFSASSSNNNFTELINLMSFLNRILSMYGMVSAALNLGQLLNILNKIYQALDQVKRIHGSLEVIFVESDLIMLSLLQRFYFCNDLIKIDLIFMKVLQKLSNSTWIVYLTDVQCEPLPILILNIQWFENIIFFTTTWIAEKEISILSWKWPSFWGFIGRFWWIIKNAESMF